MRIGILSGAVKNAGDYLIVNRGKEILKRVFDEPEILKFNRLERLDDQLNLLNSCDGLFLMGGPLFIEKIYPDYMPLVEDLNTIKVPIFTMGNGWYGKNNLPETIYDNYKFSKETKRFLERIKKDEIGGISCRDWYTWRLLNNNDFDNCVMTGCPAWYDVGIIQKGVERINEINKICVSDPSYKININKVWPLICNLIDRYPNAKIVYIFHRGIVQEGEKGEKVSDLIHLLENNEIEYVDISGNYAGFTIYDDCDLHIGFRVHAHIYNMSRRQMSVLIHEDARGIGFDEAVGIKGIQPYFFEYDECKKTVVIRDNIHYLNEVNDVLDIIEKTDKLDYKIAFMKIDETYHVMLEYLERIKTRI